jgi:hypothetical protein
MKILLLGDFSSVQYNLKKGLEILGHNVTLISKGDGFKKIGTDIKVYTRSASENKFAGAFKEIGHQLIINNKIRNFDIVQTASSVFFHNRIDDFLFPKIFENNNRTILLNTACSFPYNQYVRKLKYSPCAECKKNDLINESCMHEEKNAQKKEYDRYEKYNAVVSTHFEYFNSFNETPFKNKNHFIPVPIILENFEYIHSNLEGKLNIYYGEIRKGFKGGKYIEEALEKLRSSNYSKYFNIITTKHLSYSQYINVIQNCHILIDQASSYSYGVNALNGLAYGKVVLSGSESEATALLTEDQSKNPIVNISPSAEDIYEKLIWLLDNKSQINNIGLRGREFIEEFHSLEKVAKKYENLYLST